MNRNTVTLDDRAKRLRAEYQKQWRAKNPGKNSEYCKRYWAKRARAQDEADRQKTGVQ